MLIIESWLDSHLLEIGENDYKKFLNYEKEHRFDENDIRTLVSKCILDELGGKFYNPHLGTQLTETISKNIRRDLAARCKSYRIIIQTFVGKMSEDKIPNGKLYASCHFDQRTDKCLSIIENNGQM